VSRRSKTPRAKERAGALRCEQDFVLTEEPENPGVPAMARVAMNIVQKVQGIFLAQAAHFCAYPVRRPSRESHCPPQEQQSLKERMRHQ